MDPTPVLYKINASPPARAVMMIIDILGIDVDQRDLNPLLREQDTPEMKKKNPMRTIPIWDEGDYSLGDSHAIILYLLDKYGRPEHSQLYPCDKRKRAMINQRLFFDCGILFPRLQAVMSPTYTGRLGEMTRYMTKNIEYAYGMLEDYLSETSYLADDAMTIADISALTTVSSLHGLHPINETRFPKVIRWLRRMNEKEVCKRINTPGSEEHVAGLKMLMENTKRTQTQSKL